MPSRRARSPGRTRRLGIRRSRRRSCSDGASAWRRARSRTSTIGELKKFLLALASKSPPNAAHSVLNSLTLWEGRPPADGQLKRQGEVWRPILAGEVAAKDLLHVSDYVGTAEQVVGRLQDVTRQALRGRLRWLVLMILALIVAGVALLLNTDTSGGVTAGAGSLLAAFGLTWKGIGHYLGHAAAKGEQALWDAQLNWTIAYRATLTSVKGAPQASPDRQAAHVQEWAVGAQKGRTSGVRPPPAIESRASAARPGAPRS